MARTRTNISIDNKIEQQKLVVSKCKDKYDAAVEELEKLMRKRDELRNKELLNGFASSKRSFDEVMRFIMEGNGASDE